MIPKTPDELFGAVTRAVILRVYADVSALAGRRRLSEADLAAIERRAIELLGDGAEFADEFAGFEAEPVIARARGELLKFFAEARRLRRAVE